jgi:hypothetical protein
MNCGSEIVQSDLSFWQIKLESAKLPVSQKKFYISRNTGDQIVKEVFSEPSQVLLKIKLNMSLVIFVMFGLYLKMLRDICETMESIIVQYRIWRLLINKGNNH